MTCSYYPLITPINIYENNFSKTFDYNGEYASNKKLIDPNIKMSLKINRITFKFIFVRFNDED